MTLVFPKVQYWKTAHYIGSYDIGKLQITI